MKLSLTSYFRRSPLFFLKQYLLFDCKEVGGRKDNYARPNIDEFCDETLFELNLYARCPFRIPPNLNVNAKAISYRLYSIYM